MEYQFEILRASRNNILFLLDAHSIEEINTIPEGYNNNLIWNAAHVVVIQQMLNYGLSGLPLLVPDELVANFRKGTKPDGYIGQQEVDEIKDLLRSLPEKLETDYKGGSFLQFNPFSTGFGISVNSIEESITFNIAHEAMHIGYMLAIRRRLKTQE